MAAIEIDGLTKYYGDFLALDNLDLEIDAGEIFGFLGPNGAGKTTTIQLMMGMLVPSDGTCLIKGLDAEEDRVELKSRVGYLPDDPTFHDYLTGSSILEFVGRMHDLKGAELYERVNHLLDTFDLDRAREEFAVNYSSGMKKKLALACAQIHDPDVYILDEPMRGLDPHTSRDIQDWIRESAEAGTTIFLSTHILERAQNLCTSVGIINEGTLIEEGDNEEVRQLLRPGGTLEEVFLKLTEEAEEEPHVEPASPDQPSSETDGEMRHRPEEHE